jgi:hypothetical protein
MLRRRALSEQIRALRPPLHGAKKGRSAAGAGLGESPVWGSLLPLAMRAFALCSTYARAAARLGDRTA